MKKETEKPDHLDFVSKNQDCKNWSSEIANWKAGMQFMKDMTFRLSTKLEDENRLLEIRTFFQELEEMLKVRLDWYIQKLELHTIGIKSYFKKSNIISVSELRIQHDMLRKEIEHLRDQYVELRASFFDLIKPALKKRRNSKRATTAA